MRSMAAVVMDLSIEVWQLVANQLEWDSLEAFWTAYPGLRRLWDTTSKDHKNRTLRSHLTIDPKDMNSMIGEGEVRMGDRQLLTFHFNYRYISLTFWAHSCRTCVLIQIKLRNISFTFFEEGSAAGIKQDFYLPEERRPLTALDYEQSTAEHSIYIGPVIRPRGEIVPLCPPIHRSEDCVLIMGWVLRSWTASPSVDTPRVVQFIDRFLQVADVVFLFPELGS